MASDLALNDAEKSNDPLAGDSVENTKPFTNGEATDKPSTNATGLPPSGPAPTADPSEIAPGDKTLANPTPISTLDGAKDDTPKGNPDKPISTSEDNTAIIPPSDFKNAGAVSGGAVPADQTSGLGSILKGSPFEEKEAKEAKKARTPKSTKSASKSSATMATTKAHKLEAKAPSVMPVNGKPREAQANKPAQEFPSASGSVNGKPKEAEKSRIVTEAKPKAAASGLIETQPATPVAPSSTADSAVAEPKEDSSSVPRTANGMTTSAKQASPKKTSPPKAASPKVGPSQEAAKKDIGKEIKKPSNRLSGVSKTPTATTSKPHAPKPPPPSSTTTTKPPIKKAGPSSPPASAFTKPRPKSPTRPAKLPASATAPTAASAARLDGTAPSMGDRRPMNMASVAKEKGPSTQPHLKAKPGRASMPGGSKLATEKPKAKPRTSMTSNKAPEGGFLERMMRPTQSSAQKTHDKVESKSPPRKTAHPMKPRVTSGGDHGHQGHGDMNLDKLRDSSARAGHPEADESEGPTQSSAQKTHEKVESKSPPRHSGPRVTPKSVADGDHGHRGHGDIDLGGKSAPASHAGAEEAEAQTQSSAQEMHEKIESTNHPGGITHHLERTSDGNHSHRGHGDIDLGGKSAPASHAGAEEAEAQTQSSAQKMHEKIEVTNQSGKATAHEASTNGVKN